MCRNLSNRTEIGTDQLEGCSTVFGPAAAKHLSPLLLKVRLTTHVLDVAERS